MSDVSRGTWASAVTNGDFICVETYSGYRGGSHRDPAGRQYLLRQEEDDQKLGEALIGALGCSRFVLAVPRVGSTYPPALEFDESLYDYKRGIERYAIWTRSLMDHYGYRTKRELFKNMKRCDVEERGGVITIAPNHHEKLEAWGRDQGDGIEDVVIEASSSPSEIGAALRLAFSRCTG
jgi:hypothetical protein